jgi:hypothetical protein
LRPQLARNDLVRNLFHRTAPDFAVVALGVNRRRRPDAHATGVEFADLGFDAKFRKVGDGDEWSDGHRTGIYSYDYLRELDSGNSGTVA